MNAPAVATLGSFVSRAPRVERPDVCGPLAVFPLVGGGSVPVRFRVLSPRTGADVVVRELPGGAAVNRLLVENHSDVGVLLYEGQELVGARQNRVVERSVVVPPGGSLEVAVLCIEEKRWDGRRTAEAFSVGARVAHASFRTTISRSRVTGSRASETQHLAWTHVRQRVTSHRTPTRTMSLSDVFDGRRELVVGMTERFTARAGQVGAIAALRGRLMAIDLVASPEAWSELHPGIVQGYVFDALEVLTDPPSVPSREAVEATLGAVLGSPVQATSPAGAATRVQVVRDELEASATVLGGALVQLAAHFAEGRAR